MSISEQDYEERAIPELRALVDALDALELSGLECELSSDILTLELADGNRYVVNSHRAARQIWMAADRNAWHFDWDAERSAWVAKKTGDELWGTLSRVLSSKLGQSVSLRHA
ncbi:MAG TPA: iron donor protein CyaY [Polyangiaceae bacterium]|nr:iron donor protein CyaY [Polyangiaceae bacterium]